MKRHNILFRFAADIFLALLSVGVVACNDDSESIDKSEIVSVESVAVNAFSLEANARVLSGLDSVFFSVDLEHGVIFNADSLPKGTDVSALVAKITYPSSVSSAIVEMNGGSKRTGTINYLDNPTDTIDFSGQVTLRLATGSGLEKSYRLKVNVHNSNPDSLIWDKIAYSTIPSRLSAPKAQKTIAFNGGTLCMIEERDGSYTRAFLQEKASEWQKSIWNTTFLPRLSSLTAVGQSLYILSADGTLMSSSDGVSWISTSQTWHSIIGPYDSALLGIKIADGKYWHTSYPDTTTDTELEQGFPISGFSNSGSFTSVWAAEPTTFIVGGTDAAGKKVAATWAYDGSRWANISNRPLAPLQNASIFPYYSFRNSASGAWSQNEYSVWLALGGTAKDGSLNKSVFISYDNGVNWEKAPQLLQLPDYINALNSPDILVASIPMRADLADNWKSTVSARPTGARITYSIDGNTIHWECPYVYFYGGTDAAGVLNDKIWRGVLARLSFAPLF
ncbi:MAG: DUF6242 domain-containing protein [Clostridium sp.]|nr:DUF6242 domain-containing protein [Prevotella sp.]MCM1429548.1 DUF6242 domain-containing protein [Clostridium sp.]MCM1476044.1 DUF6242 domain-containing protein [Muribaculaceae bacterium]